MMNWKNVGVSVASTLLILANTSIQANAEWKKDREIVIVSQNEDDDFGLGVTPEATVFQSQMQVKAKVSSNGTSTLAYQALGDAIATATYKQAFTFYTLGNETAPSTFQVPVNDTISGSASGSATTKYTNGDPDTYAQSYYYASSSGPVSSDSTSNKPSYSTGTTGGRTVTADPDTGSPRRASISFSLSASADVYAAVGQAEEYPDWYLEFSLDAEAMTTVTVGDPL